MAAAEQKEAKPKRVAPKKAVPSSKDKLFALVETAITDHAAAMIDHVEGKTTLDRQVRDVFMGVVDALVVAVKAYGSRDAPNDCHELLATLAGQKLLVAQFVGDVIAPYVADVDEDVESVVSETVGPMIGDGIANADEITIAATHAIILFAKQYGRAIAAMGWPAGRKITVQLAVSALRIMDRNDVCMKLFANVHRVAMAAKPPAKPAKKLVAEPVAPPV